MIDLLSPGPGYRPPRLTWRRRWFIWREVRKFRKQLRGMPG